MGEIKYTVDVGERIRTLAKRVAVLTNEAALLDARRDRILSLVDVIEKELDEINNQAKRP